MSPLNEKNCFTQFLDDQDVPIREFESGRGRVVPEDRQSWSERPPLEPFWVHSSDGRKGWCVRLPEKRPLATPAVSGGRVFIGGGFGSHEFYAFEALTGRLAWQTRTNDDGPTAAVVSGDRVAFNTESCTIYVVDAATGRQVWNKWLGDPLLAQPAMHGDAVVMVYPDRSHTHVIACFGLNDGALRWQAKLNGDVITAPIIAEDSVYAATLDGTVYRFALSTGQELWSGRIKATSAPWIHRGEIFVSLREAAAGFPDDVEGIDSVREDSGRRRQQTSSSRRHADYLKHQKGGIKEAMFANMDSGVGFGNAPSAAKLHMAEAHLGVGRVSSMWAYQGSRPEVFEDGIYATMDDVIQRLDLQDRTPVWRAKLVASNREHVLGRVLNPPAVTAESLYLTSGLGDLVALDRTTGEESWALSVPGRILGQPSFSGGRVYFGTDEGMLFSFETEDTDEVGWPMWGGGPGHNGI